MAQGLNLGSNGIWISDENTAYLRFENPIDLKAASQLNELHILGQRIRSLVVEEEEMFREIQKQDNKPRHYRFGLIPPGVDRADSREAFKKEGHHRGVDNQGYGDNPNQGIVINYGHGYAGRPSASDRRYDPYRSRDGPSSRDRRPERRDYYQSRSERRDYEPRHIENYGSRYRSKDDKPVYRDYRRDRGKPLYGRDSASWMKNSVQRLREGDEHWERPSEYSGPSHDQQRDNREPSWKEEDRLLRLDPFNTRNRGGKQWSEEEEKWPTDRNLHRNMYDRNRLFRAETDASADSEKGTGEPRYSILFDDRKRKRGSNVSESSTSQYVDPYVEMAKRDKAASSSASQKGSTDGKTEEEKEDIDTKRPKFQRFDVSHVDKENSQSGKKEEEKKEPSEEQFGPPKHHYIKVECLPSGFSLTSLHQVFDDCNVIEENTKFVFAEKEALYAYVEVATPRDVFRACQKDSTPVGMAILSVRPILESMMVEELEELEGSASSHSKLLKVVTTNKEIVLNRLGHSESEKDADRTGKVIFDGIPSEELAKSFVKDILEWMEQNMSHVDVLGDPTEEKVPGKDDTVHHNVTLTLKTPVYPSFPTFAVVNKVACMIKREHEIAQCSACREKHSKLFIDKCKSKWNQELHGDQPIVHIEPESKSILNPFSKLPFTYKDQEFSSIDDAIQKLLKIDTGYDRNELEEHKLLTWEAKFYDVLYELFDCQVRSHKEMTTQLRNTTGNHIVFISSDLVLGSGKIDTFDMKLFDVAYIPGSNYIGCILEKLRDILIEEYKEWQDVQYLEEVEVLDEILVDLTESGDEETSGLDKEKVKDAEKDSVGMDTSEGATGSECVDKKQEGEGKTNSVGKDISEGVTVGSECVNQKQEDEGKNDSVENVIPEGATVGSECVDKKHEGEEKTDSVEKDIAEGATVGSECVDQKQVYEVLDEILVDLTESDDEETSGLNKEKVEDAEKDSVGMDTSEGATGSECVDKKQEDEGKTHSVDTSKGEVAGSEGGDNKHEDSEETATIEKDTSKGEAAGSVGGDNKQEEGNTDSIEKDISKKETDSRPCDPMVTADLQVDKSKEIHSGVLDDNDETIVPQSSVSTEDNKGEVEGSSSKINEEENKSDNKAVVGEETKEKKVTEVSTEEVVDEENSGTGEDVANMDTLGKGGVAVSSDVQGSAIEDLDVQEIDSDDIYEDLDDEMEEDSSYALIPEEDNMEPGKDADAKEKDVIVHDYFGLQNNAGNKK